MFPNSEFFFNPFLSSMTIAETPILSKFLTVNSLVFIIAKELGVLELSIKHDSSEAILPPNNYGIFSNKMIKKHHYNKFKTLQESLPNYIKWYNKNN